jgi:hypothetical protein
MPTGCYLVQFKQMKITASYSRHQLLQFDLQVKKPNCCHQHRAMPVFQNSGGFRGGGGVRPKFTT